MSPFDYVNEINYGKKNIMVDDLDEKQYVPYMVNRALSYYSDTVLYANEMNKLSSTLDNKLQFQYLINIIRKNKRFNKKWIKPDEESNIEVIKEYYGYSNEKARQTLKLLTPEQINILKEKVYKGGRK